jgi:hypothetical protein
MVIIQEEYQPRNNSATTNDWIGQVKGHAIYAYDLSALRPDNQDMVQNTVQKYKDRFKEAWEELSVK